MNLRLVFANLRLVIWPLCMAYAAFLLADTKSFFAQRHDHRRISRGDAWILPGNYVR
jgi:hypothetical protein